jgi:hypothetical protein
MPSFLEVSRQIFYGDEQLVCPHCSVVFHSCISFSKSVRLCTQKFYPNVIHDQQLADSSAYCKFNDHLLTLWTSSMFLAGAVASAPLLTPFSLSNRLRRMHTIHSH